VWQAMGRTAIRRRSADIDNNAVERYSSLVIGATITCRYRQRRQGQPTSTA
jgi:hypothetical protein